MKTIPEDLLVELNWWTNELPYLDPMGSIENCNTNQEEQDNSPAIKY